MSFLKSKKYKLGGGSSKSKGGSQSHQIPATQEHFKPISSTLASNPKSSKGKAPSAPGTASASGGQSSVKFNNKTKFDWKLHSGGKTNVFPNHVSAGESKQLQLNSNQGPVQATYIINITNDDGTTESFEFDVTLAKNDGTFELMVDWKLLSERKEIRFKPDISSSNQPIKLNTADVVIEMATK